MSSTEAVPAASATPMIDYYAILGIPDRADRAMVLQAFRRLAARHHPDRHPGDALALQRFKAINEARAVLSDPRKRAEYDLLRGTRRFRDPGPESDAEAREPPPITPSGAAHQGLDGDAIELVLASEDGPDTDDAARADAHAFGTMTAGRPRADAVAPAEVAVVDAEGRWLESVLCAHCLTFSPAEADVCRGCGAPLPVGLTPALSRRASRWRLRDSPLLWLTVASVLAIGLGLALGWLLFAGEPPLPGR